MNLSGLPPYLGNKKTIKNNHDVYDIVNEVCAAHETFSGDYDKIANQFWKGDIKKTCDGLFDFCKRNFKYKIEPGNLQTTRSPAAILKTGNTVGLDCKHYAGFIAGVLDALRRQGLRVNWCYRFASYNANNKNPEHVFVVVKISGKDYYIDPVLSQVNQKSPLYYYKIDKKINMLERISGVGGLNELIRSQPIFNQDKITVPGTRPTVITPPVITDTGLPAAETPETVVITEVEARLRKQNLIPWLIAGGVILFLLMNKKRKK